MEQKGRVKYNNRLVGYVEGMGSWLIGGGRIVAASEMLRPSVGHLLQAEVMPRSSKSSLTVTSKGRQ